MKVSDTGNENVMSSLIPRFERLYSAQQALSCKHINLSGLNLPTYFFQRMGAGKKMTKTGFSEWSNFGNLCLSFWLACLVKKIYFLMEKLHFF